MKPSPLYCTSQLFRPASPTSYNTIHSNKAIHHATQPNTTQTTPNPSPTNTPQTHKTKTCQRGCTHAYPASLMPCNPPSKHEAEWLTLFMRPLDRFIGRRVSRYLDELHITLHASSHRQSCVTREAGRWLEPLSNGHYSQLFTGRD